MGSCVFVRCPAGPCGVQPAERVLSAGSADALFCSMPARASPKSQPPLGTGHADSLLVGRELESWGRPPIDYRASREESTAGNSPVPRVGRSRWSHGPRGRASGDVPVQGYIAQILNGASPGGHSYLSGNEVRVAHLFEGCRRDWAHHPVLAARACRRGAFTTLPNSARMPSPAVSITRPPLRRPSGARPPGDPSGHGRSVPHRLPSGCYSR